MTTDDPIDKQASLFKAFDEQQPEAIKKLILDHPDLVNSFNEMGESALFCACAHHRLYLVDFLIEQGADVNLKNKNTDGWAPLHLATSTLRHPIIKALLKAGGDINLTTSQGWTSLHIASRGDHHPTLQLLLKQDPKPNLEAEDDCCETPLFDAMINRETATVFYLIEQGSNVQHRNETHETILFTAIRQHDVDMVQRLTALGLDVHTPNLLGHTPLAIAKSQNAHHEGSVYAFLKGFIQAQEERDALEKLLSFKKEPSVSTFDEPISPARKTL